MEIAEASSQSLGTRCWKHFSPQADPRHSQVLGKTPASRGQDGIAFAEGATSEGAPGVWGDVQKGVTGVTSVSSFINLLISFNLTTVTPWSGFTCASCYRTDWCYSRLGTSLGCNRHRKSLLVRWSERPCRRIVDTESLVLQICFSS